MMTVTEPSSLTTRLLSALAAAGFAVRFVAAGLAGLAAVVVLPLILRVRVVLTVVSSWTVGVGLLGVLLSISLASTMPASLSMSTELSVTVVVSCGCTGAAFGLAV